MEKKSFEAELEVLRKKNSDLETANVTLQKKESLFKDLQHLTKIGGWEWDVEKQSMYWTAETYRIHGYKPEDIEQGSTDHIEQSLECYDPDDRPKIINAFKKCITKGISYDLEFPFTTIAGNRIWIRTKAKAVKEQNKIIRVIGNIIDITERKNSKKLLEESENKYRELFEKSKDAILIIENGKFVDCNQATVDMLGYKNKDELLQTHPSELSPLKQPDGRKSNEKADEMMKTAIKTGSNRFEWNHVRANGNIFPVEVLLTPITIEKGKQIIHTVWRDITERKEADNDLKTSENKYRELFEKSKDAILIIENGKFVDCNQATVDMLGYKNKEELLQTHPSELSPPKQPDGRDSDEKADLMIKIAIETGSNRFEWDHIRANGEVFPVEVLLTPITIGKSKQIIHTVWRDITERKIADNALKYSEEKFREMAELLPEIIFESDIFGNLTFVNKQAFCSFGYSRKEFEKGINALQTLIPEDRERAQNNIGKILTGEKVGSPEYTALKKDGSTFPVLIYSNPILKSNKPIGLRGIIVDITARRQLEEQLRQSQKMEAVGQLAGGVAHDFNNLLTIINGYCDLLLMRDIPPKIKKPLDQIKFAGEKATKLTSQLLAFSRKQVIQPKILNLNTLITDQSKMIRRLLGENIEIAVLPFPDLKNIKADSGQIEQIIMNLAINARDAMPFGGKMTIETGNAEFDQFSIKNHSGMKPGKFVMLAISDNGVGMDEKTKSRIFEPFFTTKGREKGTGLGLATVYGIIKQNGGFVLVESKEHKGSTFKTFLPIVDELNGEKETIIDQQKVFSGNEKIFLVEDDPGVREVTQSTLENYGYSVITASNGEEALRIYKEHHKEIDILLTDVIMPLMGGKELAENLLKISPELKIIFFSGYTDNSIEHHGVLDEGIEFIQKPYSPNDLVKKIRTVLDK